KIKEKQVRVERFSSATIRSFPRAVALTAVAAACCVLPQMPSAHAQGFPSKNRVMVVPYPAGGSIDIYARAISQELGKVWGRNIIVDNRAGASGMIGTDIPVQMDPQGH